MFSVTIDYMTKKWSGGSPPKPEDEENVNGKFVIVTGSNTGIGKEAAFEFAKRGATVIMACRDLDKCQKALDDIKSKCAGANLLKMKLDIGDLDSTRKFAKTIQEQFPKIHFLINNAGIQNTSGKLEKTVNGFESQIGVNHLGPFLLTNLLLDNLRAGAPSRIVFVASTMHKLANLTVEDLMVENLKNHGPMNLVPYGNSKYANMLTARELSKRVEGSGISVYSICPGMVKTELSRDMSGFKKLMQKTGNIFSGLTPKQGCESILYCALSKNLETESGQMFRFCKKWDDACTTLDNNTELAEKLWKISEELVGLRV